MNDSPIGWEVSGDLLETKNLPPTFFTFFLEVSWE